MRACRCVRELKMICINQCWGMCGGGGEDGRGACRWGSPMIVMYIIVKGRKERGGGGGYRIVQQQKPCAKDTALIAVINMQSEDLLSPRTSKRVPNCHPSLLFSLTGDLTTAMPTLNMHVILG